MTAYKTNSKQRGFIASYLVTLLSLIYPTYCQANGMLIIDPISPNINRIAIPTPTPGNGQVLKGHVSYGLHVEEVQVKVEITGQIARTHVSQVFMNDTNQNLAGTYLFPLPEDTTFSSFSLHIDGKPVEGKLLEATAARTEYENIVRKMIDPGLLEYMDSRTVRLRVFPIPAHGQRKIDLAYSQILKADQGVIKYKFPLRTTSSEEPVSKVDLSVKINSDKQLAQIWSPTHIIATTRSQASTGKYTANSIYKDTDKTLDKDFILLYGSLGQSLSTSSLCHKDDNEEGYVLLSMTPSYQHKAPSPKNLVLVVDTSGSMEGKRIDETRQALKTIINSLHDQDNFNLIQFNTGVEHFSNKLVAATKVNKSEALDYIDELEASGATNISGALEATKSMLDNAKQNAENVVIFMTDGEATVGETDKNKLLSFAPENSRIFTVGIGYDVNTQFLDKLAKSHHGLSEYVEPEDNVDTTIKSFLNKLTKPAMRNVKLSFQDIKVSKVYPRAPLDLYAGQQLVLLGRYNQGGKGSITVSGEVDGKVQNQTFPIELKAQSRSNSFLPKLWAARRIANLTEQARENNNPQEIVQEIISLSKKFGIISEFTSFLATDPNESIRRPAPAIVNMPQSAQSSVGASAGRIAFMEDKDGQSFAKAMDAKNESSLGKEKKLDFRVQQVRQAKTNSKLAQLNSVEESPTLTKTRRSKMVGDRCFYFVNNSWIDSLYYLDKPKEKERITFMSKRYLDLLRTTPELRQYLSLGRNVTFVYKNKCYEIIES